MISVFTDINCNLPEILNSYYFIANLFSVCSSLRFCVLHVLQVGASVMYSSCSGVSLVLVAEDKSLPEDVRPYTRV